LMNVLPGREYTTLSEGVFGLERNPIGTEAIRDRMATSFDLGYQDIEEIPPNMRPFAKGGEVFSETAALVAPVGLAANAAKGVNTAAQAAKSTKKGMKTAAQAAEATKRARAGKPQGAIPAAIDEILESTAKNPGSAAAIELGMGITPAIGAGAAEEIAPGNPTASMYGQLLGSLSPIAAVKALDLGGRAAGGTANIIKERFKGEAGSKSALRAGLKAQGLDDAQIDELAKRAAKAQAGETSAQATGSPEIKRMQNMLAGLNEEFAGRIKRQADRARDVQNSKIRTVVDEADQAVTLDQVKARVDNANRQLDKLVNKAQAKAVEAQSSLRNMDDQGSRINAATKAREILTTALEDARTLEKTKWNKIPKNAQVNVGESSEFAKAKKKVIEEYSMPAAQVEEAWRVRFALDKKSEKLNESMSDLQRKAKGKKAIKAETLPAGQILKLRTQYLREARNVSSGAQPDYQKAAAYRILADSLLDDITRDVDGGVVKEAREFSRSLNQKFNQGYVGKVLGRTPRGDAAVPENQTLRGLKGDFTDQQNAIAATQRAAGKQAPAMQQQQQEFMRGAASEALKLDSSVDAAALNRFIVKNSKALETLGMKGELETVQGKAKFAKMLQDQQKQFDSFINKKSVAAQIVGDDDIGKTINRVMRGQSRNEGIAQLVRTVKRTGNKEALDGLRHGMFENILANATQGGVVRGDLIDNYLNATVRGSSLQQVLAKEGLLSDAQVNNLKRFTARLKQYDAASANKDKAAELQAEADILNTLVSIGALKAQSASPLAVGGGGALAAASAFVRFVRNFIFKAPLQKITNTLTEAMSDPKLMATLLERPGNTIRQRNQIKRFYAALVSAGIFGATDLMTEE
jgi:uncharacterized protein YfcZ (UPF0381/DUF406 family)